MIIPNPNRQTKGDPMREKSNMYNIDDLAIIDDEAGWRCSTTKQSRERAIKWARVTDYEDDRVTAVTELWQSWRSEAGSPQEAGQIRTTTRRRSGPWRRQADIGIWGWALHDKEDDVKAGKLAGLRLKLAGMANFDQNDEIVCLGCVCVSTAVTTDIPPWGLSGWSRHVVTTTWEAMG
jgi:hypothetical protein